MTQLALLPEDRGTVVRRTVVFPFTPPSKNVYMNWQPLWQKSHRDKWAKWLREAAEAQQFPRNCNRVAVSAKLVFASKARRDWQNYLYPLMQVVPDVLVEVGVIPDDTPQYFTVGPNGGIEFGVDKRLHVPVKDRSRTILGLAFEL